MLIQQTSNWLLKLWPSVLNGEAIPDALKSVSFLNNSGEILENGRLKAGSAEEICKPHCKLLVVLRKSKDFYKCFFCRYFSSIPVAYLLFIKKHLQQVPN